jgi:glycosyltransferase involved in cell wall biosynthesis
MRPIRVLFIHHYGAFGGSSRSLLELIAGFPPGTVEAYVLTPPGTVSDILPAAGIRCLPCRGMSLFDNTRYGYYRGLRWLILLREIARIPSTVAAVRGVRRWFPDFDIIHVNEIVMLLGLVLASRWYGRPAVVHVRAVQRQAPGWAGRLVRGALTRHASALIAIDETVRRSLPCDLAVPVTVIHNGFTPAPPESPVRSAPRDGRLVVAMIGNLLRAKGCREFVEAAAICQRDGLAARFVFVGTGELSGRRRGSRMLRWLGIEQNIEQELRATVARRELTDIVDFRPFTTDLTGVYRSVDIVCFPSHLDAPGRPIFEAAFFGVPAIAAISAPTPDTFVDGETGLKIAAGSPEDIARAVRYLLEHPDTRERLGRNARQLAESQFDARRNALSVLEVYRRLIGPAAATLVMPSTDDPAFGQRVRDGVHGVSESR